MLSAGVVDETIVYCGLEKAAICPIVTIIGEDVDLIVLLLAFAPRVKNIFFLLKPGRGKVDSTTNKHSEMYKKSRTITTVILVRYTYLF